MNIETPKNHPLGIAMEVAVPLWILSIREKGGLTNQDFIEAKETSDLLGIKGDRLIYGKVKTDKDGVVADLFNRTAKAIAVLSYCPGGITIFGKTFTSDILSKQKMQIAKLKELREKVLKQFKDKHYPKITRRNK